MSLRSRTTKGKMIFHPLAVFVFHFIMLEISLVHPVAQFCLLVYKGKKKCVASSRAPLIEIDPVLKVNIKRNDLFCGRLEFVNPSECNAWCVCEEKK